MTKKEMRYDTAVREIEETLDSIEKAELGVDELAGKVERVTQLLKLCRDRLHQTESQVNEILENESPDAS